MTKALELEGTVVNGFEILRRLENSRTGQTRWEYKCFCGKISSATTSSIRRMQSCGCLRDIRIGNLNKTHGHSVGRKSTRTMNSWRGMKERCNNPKNSHFPIYGGRGISYPKEWETLEGFIKDMGERPEGMTLERIDVNLSYSKDNCKWDTLTNQAYNINIKSNNTSGRTGVRPSRNGKGWVAHIGFQKERIYLGTFLTFEEAIIARQEAELKYYGFNKK